MSQDEELFGLFIKELEEHLESLENGLLELEKPSEEDRNEVVHEVFRACHSIKGAAGFFGYEGIRELSHTMESAFDLVRNDEFTLNSAFTDLMLHCLDCLKGSLEDIGNPGDPDLFKREIHDILRLTEGAEVPQEEQAQESLDISETDVFDDTVEDTGFFNLDEDMKSAAGKFGKTLYGITLAIGDDLLAKNRNVKGFLDDLSQLGEILKSDPDEKTLSAVRKNRKKVLKEIHLLFSTVLDSDLLLEELDIPEGRFQILFPEKKKEESVPDSVDSEETQDNPLNEEKTSPSISVSRARKQQYIRVRTDLLDDLMKTAGELVLSRNELLQNFKGEPEYREIIQGLDRITTELQGKVMQTRMQPLRSLFKKYPRMVRDISSELNKNIELEVDGEDVELDSSILENLSDPLNHIIRNSCDHGIEPPEERLAAGKSATGRLVIQAFYEGEQVIIEIRDNGRGLDREKIIHRIFEKGFASDEELARMNKAELFSYIFRPGFSTAEKVSGISGRGVGMDVVLTNIKNLGGEVTVDSEEGRGTKVKLVLPLTIAITPALIVGVEDELFAINQSDVVDIMSLKSTYTERKIEKVRGIPVVRRDGTLLPLLYLSDVLGLDRTYTDPKTGERLPDRRKSIADRRARELAEQDLNEENLQRLAELQEKRKCPDRRKSNELLVVVVRYQDNTYGLIVNRMIGMEEIVVKPLPAFLQTPCYSGTTIRGEGNVLLILNTSVIAQQGGLRFGEADEIAQKEEEEKLRSGEIFENQNILICRISDDAKIGIPLDIIQRVEDIREHSLRKVDDAEYVYLNGKNIRIIPCRNNIIGADDSVEIHFLLIPRMNPNLGFGVKSVEDFIQIPLVIDSDPFDTPALFGAVTVDGENILVPDLFEIADRYSEENTGSNGNVCIGKKLLLIEDTPFYQQMERVYLEKLDLDVVTASNGKEGLRRLTEESFDLVACDLKMPIMDGYGFVQEVRAQPKLREIPVLGLTCLSEKDDFGSSDGFDEYAVKTDRTELLEKAALLAKGD